MSKTSVASIAIENGKVLVAHRNPTGQMGGRWEFPGGKADEGETDEQAVIREFKEEFGADITVGEKITESSFEHNGEKVLLHAWRIFVPHDGMKTPYVLTEHTEYKWVKFSEIKSLNFVDSDMLIYPEVCKYAEKNGVEL